MPFLISSSFVSHPMHTIKLSGMSSSLITFHLCWAPDHFLFLFLFFRNACYKSERLEVSQQKTLAYETQEASSVLGPNDFLQGSMSSYEFECFQQQRFAITVIWELIRSQISVVNLDVNEIPRLRFSSRGWLEYKFCFLNGLRSKEAHLPLCQ